MRKKQSPIEDGSKSYLFPTRRLCLAEGCKLAFSAVVLSSGCKGSADPSAERWLDTWIAEAKIKSGGDARAPEGPLWVSRFKDPMYFLLRQIAWRPNSGQENYPAIVVPRGFVTDLASIPQVFWSLLRPDGDYAYAAILHDYLYWSETRTRAESDEIFKFAMEDFRIDSIKIKTIYGAVRAAGQHAWNENRRLQGAGEKRVLNKFPEDPRITWAEWKRMPGVLE